jgi:methionyl-tRNA formyltransferase
LADTLGIKTEQPESLKNFHLEKEVFDVAVTAQYGLLIPSHLFEETKHGFVNVHTSLLPKYRGASPIQTALINGETETGVTIIIMDAGMDTGDILSQEKINQSR